MHPAGSTLFAALTLSHAVASAAAPSGSEPPAAKPATASIWKQVAPGVERATTDDGALGLELFRFDLARFDAEVVVAGRDRPPHARIWLPGPSHTAAEVLEGAGSLGVVAAVNGGFFDERGRSLGLRLIHGDVAVPLRGKVDWGVFFVAGRHARIVHSKEFVPRPGIDAAIQVGPRILIDGAVPKLKPQVARRTALAVDRDGGTLTLVVADQPAEASALGSRLAALGFHCALLLDGGPSTQVAVDAGRGGAPAPAASAPAEKVDIPGGYPVPDLLAIVRRR